MRKNATETLKMLKVAFVGQAKGQLKFLSGLPSCKTV
jgi:hypothetical protein